MKSTKKKQTEDYHIVTISSFREVVQYMYYRFSEFYKRTEGLNSPYKFSGFTFLCFLLMLNIGSLISFLAETFLGEYIDEILKFPYVFFEHKKTARIIFGGIGVIIVLGILHLLMGRETYLEIYEKFHKEMPEQRKKRKWFIILYMILTPILFIVAVSIKHGYF